MDENGTCSTGLFEAKVSIWEPLLLQGMHYVNNTVFITIIILWYIFKTKRILPNHSLMGCNTQFEKYCLDGRNPSKFAKGRWEEPGNVGETDWPNPKDKEKPLKRTAW